MELILANFSEVNSYLIYFFIFIGMLVEGEVVLLLAGVLVKSARIDFLDTLLVAFIGAALHDIIWWQIGRWLAQKGKRRFLFFDLGKGDGFLARVKKHGGLYIFVSKFAWSTNRLTLLGNGYLGTSFKTLISHSLPAVLIWAFSLLSLGYFFAAEFDLFKKDVKIAMLLIAIVFLCLVLGGELLHKIFIKNKNNRLK